VQGRHTDGSSRWARIGTASKEEVEYRSGILPCGGDKINDIETPVVSASDVCSGVQETLNHRHMAPGGGLAQGGDAASGWELWIHPRGEEDLDEREVAARHRDGKRRLAPAIDDRRVDPER
jgi:hypothetical protein